MYLYNSLCASPFSLVLPISNYHLPLRKTNLRRLSSSEIIIISPGLQKELFVYKMFRKLVSTFVFETLSVFILLSSLNLPVRYLLCWDDLDSKRFCLSFFGVSDRSRFTVFPTTVQSTGLLGLYRLITSGEVEFSRGFSIWTP